MQEWGGGAGGRQEAVGKLAKRRRRWSEKYGTCLRSLKRLVCVVLMFFFFPSPFFFVSINLECLSHRWHFHCVQNKLYISLSSLKSRWRRKVCLGVAPETFGVFEVRATTAAQRERFANNNTAEAESLSGWMEMKTLLTLLYNRATWYGSFQIHETFSLFCARSLRWAGSWPARLFKMLIWICQKKLLSFQNDHCDKLGLITIPTMWGEDKLWSTILIRRSEREKGKITHSESATIVIVIQKSGIMM